MSSQYRGLAGDKLCGQCCYFLAISEEIGKCHRYAPRPSLSVVSSGVTWPVVRTDDFCGEFEMAL